MNRRFFLALGFVAMLFNSVYQYSWNAFAPLLVRGFKEPTYAVEVAFALFVVVSTSFQVVAGRIADTTGPRVLGSLGTLALSLGLILSSLSPNLFAFYLTWTLGSVGEGVMYGISLNLAIKWYRERRGLASGLVTMGFGLGGALANPFILSLDNFRTSMLIIGLISLILTPLFLMTRYPTGLEGAPPGETVKEKKFWLIYACFTLASLPLLVASSSLDVLGNYLSNLEYTLITVYFPVASGIGRPLLGYIADRIGRMRGIDLMMLGMVGGVLITVMGNLERSSLLLLGILLVGIMGGSTFPMFSALVGDVYGSKYSTANTSILYTGKILSGVLGSVVFSSLFQVNDLAGLIFLLLSTIASISLLEVLHRV